MYGGLVERRPLWFLLSIIAILPGILFMIWSLLTTGSPLPLSIDYTGGTLWEIRFDTDVQPAEVRTVFIEEGYSDTTAFTVEDDSRTVQIKFKDIDITAKNLLVSRLESQFGLFEERFYRSIGPSIGSEVSQAALMAVIIASALILIYIAVVFRQVSNPLHYGTCAVIALLHDVLVTISFVGIMNLLVGWEIDALFLTAILTVIGFSVNDTIVVFDRIRENLRRYRSEQFSTVANRSIIETAQRSLATQITALLVLVAILMLGGATLRQFMSILIVGLVSGTYSSLFNATPILVAWQERRLFPKRATQPSVEDSRAITA